MPKATQSVSGQARIQPISYVRRQRQGTGAQPLFCKDSSKLGYGDMGPHHPWLWCQQMGSYGLPLPDALHGDTGQDFIGKKRIMISAPQAVVRVVGILIFKLPSVWHTVVSSKS